MPPRRLNKLEIWSCDHGSFPSSGPLLLKLSILGAAKFPAPRLTTRVYPQSEQNLYSPFPATAPEALPIKFNRHVRRPKPCAVAMAGFNNIR
jgi:hypothetical protein